MGKVFTDGDSCTCDGVHGMTGTIARPDFRIKHMSDIDIHHPNRLELGQAREAVDQIARKLSEKFGVECQWVGDALNFERSGVQGRIALDADDVHVTAKLGFLLAAMKGPIEAEIRRVLTEKLGPAD